MRAEKYGRQLKKNPGYMRGKRETKIGLQGIFSVRINAVKKSSINNR
jgi:hypothetical protein